MSEVQSARVTMISPKRRRPPALATRASQADTASVVALGLREPFSGRISGPFPPVVSRRPLLSRFTSAMELPALDLRRLRVRAARNETRFWGLGWAGLPRSSPPRRRPGSRTKAPATHPRACHTWPHAPPARAHSALWPGDATQLAVKRTAARDSVCENSRARVRRFEPRARGAGGRGAQRTWPTWRSHAPARPARARGSAPTPPARIDRFGRISGPLSSCRGPQAALTFSYRSDSVTRL